MKNRNKKKNIQNKTQTRSLTAEMKPAVSVNSTSRKSLAVSIVCALTLVVTLALVEISPFEEKAHAAVAPLKVDGITPSVGLPAGGEQVTINGSGFPYTTSESVVQDGLVVQLDAINNVGLGDLKHSDTTNTWVNLKKPGMDFQISSNPNGSGFGWRGESYEMGTTPWITPKTANEITNTSQGASGSITGSAKRTIELIYTVPSNFPLPGHSDHYGLFSYGRREGNQDASIRYEDNGVYLFNGYACDLTITTDSDRSGVINSLLSPSSTHTLSDVYGGGAVNTNLKAVVDGNLTTTYSPGCTSTLNTYNSRIFFGKESDANYIGTGFKLHSLRVYNRNLSDNELRLNAAVDRMRFSARPKVMFGAKECTNLVVVSTMKMTCTAPSGTSGTKVDVNMTYGQAADGSGGTTWKIGEWEYASASTASDCSLFKIIPTPTSVSEVDCTRNDDTLRFQADAKPSYTISNLNNNYNRAIIVETGKPISLTIPSNFTLTPTGKLPTINIKSGELTLNVGKNATVTLKASDRVDEEAHAGIRVTSGSSLTIQGEGKVIATGGTFRNSDDTVSGGAGAGIGGNPGETPGKITIRGSVEVQAQGGSSDCTNNTKCGTSGQAGAGIGGGGAKNGGGPPNSNGGNNFDTSILENASVTANAGFSEYSAAGIGGGGNIHAGGGMGSILIDTTGVVQASGVTTTDNSSGGAGIGSAGSNSKSPAGGKITIKNGTIIAKGGTTNEDSPAAGIGGGSSRNALEAEVRQYSGEINISGGTVIAIGGHSPKNRVSGLGIGGGIRNCKARDTNRRCAEMDAVVPGNSVTITSGSVYSQQGAGSTSFNGYTLPVGPGEMNYIYPGPTNAAGAAVYPVYVPNDAAFAKSGSAVFISGYTMPLIDPANVVPNSSGAISAPTSAASGIAYLPAQSSQATATLSKNAENRYYVTNVVNTYTPNCRTADANYDNCMWMSAGVESPKWVRPSPSANPPEKLPDGEVGVPYSYNLIASGGGVTYGLVETRDSKQLPEGLILDPSTGRISGTPRERVTEKTYTFAAYNSKKPPSQGGETVSAKLTISGGEPTLSQDAAVKPGIAGQKLSDFIVKTPTLSANGSVERSQGWEICKSGCDQAANWGVASLSKRLTLDYDSAQLRYYYESSDPRMTVYSNTVSLQVASWGVQKVDLSVPNNTTTSLPTDPKVKFDITAVAAGQGTPAGAVYCISLAISTHYDSDTETRCKSNSPNWLTATSQTVDVTAAVSNSAGAGFGKAATDAFDVMVFARDNASESGNVSVGKKVSVQLFAVQFKTNGDGGENIPTPSADRTLYALKGAKLAAFPASPTMPGFTATAWKDGVRANDGTVAGNDINSNTVFNESKTATANWTYTPKVLDFSPKKGMKTGGDEMTFLGDSFVPYGSTVSAVNASPNFHVYIGSGTQLLCTDVSLNLVDKETITCTSAPLSGATESGKVRVVN